MIRARLAVPGDPAPATLRHSHSKYVLLCAGVGAIVLVAGVVTHGPASRPLLHDSPEPAAVAAPFKFKVPTLRNVELTAPYMHDGSAATLEDAVLVMARHRIGTELREGELDALVAFLRTRRVRIRDASEPVARVRDRGERRKRALPALA